MSYFSMITGSAIATNFLGTYGSYTGNDGVIMKFLRNYVPFLDPILWIFMIACIYLIIVNVKKEGAKGLGLPIGLGLILLNFTLSGSASLIILYAALLALTMFLFWRIKDMSPHGFLGLLALIVAISYLIFGDVRVLPIFGVIAIIAFIVIKRTISKVQKGSGKERKLNKEEGFDIKPEIKAINKEHKAEHRVENTGELGQLTKDVAISEERNLELELHSSTLAAGVKNISEKMTELDNAELSVEQRDIKVLEAAEHIDQHIKSIAGESEDDVKKSEEIKEDSSKLVEILGELVKDELYEDKHRKHSIEGIQKTIEIMNNAIDRAKKILSSSSKLSIC